MNQVFLLGGAVIPVFAVIVAGALVRRLRWLSEEADQSLLRLCINLLVPALILDSVLGNAKLRQLDNLLLPPLVGFMASTAGIGLAWLVAPLSGAADSASRRTFAVTAGLQNYTYYALPLTALLFGAGTVGVLFVHNLGVEIVLWTVAVTVLSAQGIGQSWRGILNAPIIAILCSVALNLLQPHFALLQRALAPGGLLLNTAHTLGQCAIPLALLVTGAIIADYLPEIHHGPSLRIIAASLVMRFGLAPILYLLIAKYLPCSIDLKRVLLVQGAMPSAMFSIVLSRRYGGDSRVAIQIVLATTIASLLLIPIWLRLGTWFLGF
ncbi:MAG TPA: AEC family transporter [Verrucomicrobiae bacterium]|jgi:hypothetical protein|nr:AEC family transporter [Verrucomicrobiae bacterium]